MKKLLLASAILAIGATAFGEENHLYFKAGGNIISRYSKFDSKGLAGEQQVFKFTEGKTKGFGYEFAIEATHNINNNFEFGGGIAYQGNQDLKTYNNTIVYKTTMGKYDSVPLYLVGKYNFNSINGWTPYIKANLGYSFNINEKKTKNIQKDVNVNKIKNFDMKTNVKNGIYAGIGVGAEYNNFLVDLTYSVNYAKATVNYLEKDKTKSQRFDYSRLILSIGYKFDF